MVRRTYEIASPSSGLQTNCSMKYSLTVSSNLVSTSVIATAAAAAMQAPGWPGSHTARKLEENERAPKRKKGKRTTT